MPTSVPILVPPSYNSTMMASFALTKLVNRKLIKITGPDCYPYLQSLFCNDLRLLYEPDRVQPKEHACVTPTTLSSFMLNAQGRAICDTIIYRTPNTKFECDFTPPGEAKEPDELLIECDSSLASGLANTLYAYRVRRKVALQIMSNQSVWCMYPRLELDSSEADKNPVIDSRTIATTDELANTKEIVNDDFTVVNNPRLRMLGLRIISHNDEDEDLVYHKLKDLIQSQISVEITKASVKDYILHRYQLGVGEGLNDHPEANCLPLECNADLLNSVSFTKGCYLGQELTARIHFTGVVRKRLMPILIHTDTKQNDSMPIVRDTEILNEDNGKKLGVIRHVLRGRGLALLRQDLITDETKLVHAGTNTKISTWRPYWWHRDLPEG